MTEEILGARIRAAVQTIADPPPYPRSTLRARLSSAPAGTSTTPGDSRRRATRAVAAGMVLVAALAVAVPTTYHMSDAARRTFERLTGHRVKEMATYEVRPISLDEALRHTTFPVVIPPGFRISQAMPWEKNRGITLAIADRELGVVMLQERRIGIPPLQLEGVGVHDDGSIRRFNVRRWTVGHIAFSVAMYDPHYHAIAVRLERATRAAAARDPRVFSTPAR